MDAVPTEGGDMKTAHIKHVKPILPADRVVNAIPDYTQFSRRTKLSLDPNKIPDLGWTLTTKVSALPGVDATADKGIVASQGQKKQTIVTPKAGPTINEIQVTLLVFVIQQGITKLLRGLFAGSTCGVSCILKRCASVFEFPVAQAWQIDAAMISVVPEYQGYQKHWCQE